MGGLFGGGGSNSTTDPVVGALQFNTSNFGGVIPLLWGVNILTGNLIWYGDFAAIAHTETQQAGGKGGGQEMSHTSWTYAVAFMLALGEGPISDLLRAWADKEQIELHPADPSSWKDFLKGQAANRVLTLLRGDYPQDAWDYLLTHHPDQALRYQGVAVVAAGRWDLGPSPNLPQFRFEMAGRLPFAIDAAANDEPHTLPPGTAASEEGLVPVAPGPYTLTVLHAAAFLSDDGVIYTEGGVPLILVASNPEEGEYAVSAGVYEFNAADAGLGVTISYRWGAGPWEVEVTRLGVFRSDQGVRWASSGLSLTKVESNPGPGEYVVDAGLYTFNGADNGKAVLISYIYGLPIGADPAAVIQDFLTNPHYSGLMASDQLDAASLADFSQFCLAHDFLLSPALQSQTPARDLLNQWLMVCNAEAVESAGKIKVIPYGDAPATCYGVTWTPNLVPVAQLTDADFLPQGNDPPVICTPNSEADRPNHFRVEFKNRDKDYDQDLGEYQDQADVMDRGLRSADVKTCHEITRKDQADRVAQNLTNASLAVPNLYQISLGWQHILLEPMDRVTLTHAPLGLAETNCLIHDMEEDPGTGAWSVKVEEVPLGIGQAASYGSQAPLGANPNYLADPGNVNTPVIFQPPLALTAGRPEIWLAGSGGDDWGGCDVWVSESGDNYKFIGRIIGKARHGVLSAELPASSVTPDTTHTLAVDLTTSKGALLSGTQADADGLNTLCYCGEEYLAYQTATLTEAYKYNLTYLVRGCYGSGMGLHATGAAFVRLDSAIFRYAVPQNKIGQQISLKLLSFNIYGKRPQSLADVEPILYTITTPQTVLTVTGDITLDGSFETILVDASAHDVTVTLPTGSQYQGKEFDIKRVDEASLNNHSAIITVAGSTIDGAAELSLTQQYQSYRLKNDDGLYHILAVVAGLSTTKTVLNPTPVNNGYSGDVFVGTAGEDLEFGELCYQKADGKFWLARADVVGTMPVLAMAVAAISADTSGVFLQSGFIRKDSWSAWTVGGLAGLIRPSATTAGAVTQDAPAVGHQVQWVGYATAAKILFIDLDLTQYQVGVP